MADGGKVVRIGGAGGFLGDSSIAAPQLLGGGALDYMILDYLAEAAMGMLGRGLTANPKSGYARDFTDWVWKDNLAEFKRQGVKLITNAGGMNPHECRRHMEKIAAEAGFSCKIAVIDGDDVRDRLGACKAEGVSEMFTGAAFPDPGTELSANAYLGGRPIAAALSAGADVVITGRVVDSALTLGAVAYEFGWSFEDWDRMSAGALAGHVIECGAQATGAFFTDREEVGDWAHIGYPIIECRADGSFVVSKLAGTGDLVSPAAVAEQILYEVDDPQAYMLPDVVCDFSEVQVTSAGESRVLVTGAKGYPATGRYKVCLTHTDGLRTIVLMPVVGRDAAKKAARQCEAVLRRVDEMLRARNLAPFRAVSTEILGCEASDGAQARALSVREVVAKVGVEHDDDPRAFEVFMREWNSPMTSMSVGSTGWFAGMPNVAPVVRVFTFTIDRSKTPASVSLGEKTFAVGPPPVVPAYVPAKVIAPKATDGEVETLDLVTVPLIDIAWARSGDKGDAFNVGVIARDLAFVPYIRAAMSEAADKAFFAHDLEGGAHPAMVRYKAPAMNALNFHCLDALGGGQFASLRLAPPAKGKGQQLLEFPAPVPARFVSTAASIRD
jgi:hypothetical protein